jgi:hypothetical protein
LQRMPLDQGPERAEIFRQARALGGLLFGTLFDEAGAARLMRLVGIDRPRPVLQVRSDDAALLALPWELLQRDDRFLVRDGLVDLLRTAATGGADGLNLLKPPTAPFKLVVNVSAPEGSSLDWEAESWRITRATAERCPMVPPGRPSGVASAHGGTGFSTPSRTFRDRQA